MALQEGSWEQARGTSLRTSHSHEEDDMSHVIVETGMFRG